MPAMKDLTGKRFGRWTVLKRAENKGNTVMWECKCDCGNYGFVTSHSLTSGNSKSCGCYHKEIAKKISTTHGKSNTKLFGVWNGMIERTTNKNNQSYYNYGERGITICDEWKDDFKSFYDWAINNGYKDGLSIDRIDNDKGYYPENCRWVGNFEQANNKRNNHKIEFNGEIHGIEEWARIIGISGSSLLSRLKNGWTLEQALTTKPNGYMKRQKFLEYNGEVKTPKEWSEITGISYHVIMRRIEHGWKTKDALTVPMGQKIKKVMQYDLDKNFVKEFNSAKEAAEIMGCRVYEIRAVCLGKRKTCRGYIWMYKDENKCLSDFTE